MTKSERRKFPVFWTIYGLFTIGAIGAIFYGLNLLTQYLTALESVQPIHLAQSVFDQYFSSGDFEEAVELAGFEVNEFEDASHVAAVLQKMKEGKEITFYSVPSGENEAKYNVVLVDPNWKEKNETQTQTQEEETATEENPMTGFVPLRQTSTLPENSTGEPEVQAIPSTKIGTITLTRADVADRWGFVGYRFSQIEVFVQPEESVTVTLPSNSKLILNGKEVSKDYVVESEAHPYNAFLAEGIPGVTWETYRITGLYQAPATLAGVDRNQVDHVLKLDEKTGEYQALLNFSSDLKAQYSEFLMAGMKEYAKHIQNDVRFSAVIPYFDPSSVFYRHIYENLSQFVWDHNGYSFRNEYIDEFYSFDENTFCCHVSFDHVLHLRNKEDYVDVINMVIFVRRVGDKFMIYDRYNVD